VTPGQKTEFWEKSTQQHNERKRDGGQKSGLELGEGKEAKRCINAKQTDLRALGERRKKLKTGVGRKPEAHAR